MNEIIIEFGNDTLGESRIYPKNLKGYEQSIKDMKLYKAQQNHKIAVLERALELACENIEQTVAKYVDCKGGCPLYNCDINDNRLCYEKMAHYFKSQAESEIKNEKEGV